MKLEYVVNDKDKGKTINEILINNFHFSTRLLNKLIKNKLIYKNNFIADTRFLVNTNDLIIIDLGIKEDNSNIVPNEMDLNIIYEDDWLLVINKPAGIPVHPSILHYEDSLSNGVKYHFDKIGLNKKIRPVNRLDLNTSGIVVFAKCEYIQEELSRQMIDNTFEKIYLCLVNGILKEKSGIINLPISRKDGSIIEREINDTGKASVTHYKVLKEFKNYSLVQCKLETGRTHQIRVHLKAIGHPLLGDTLYGSSSNLINRQALHSYKTSFIHPITKEPLTFIADIPKDFKIE